MKTQSNKYETAFSTSYLGARRVISSPGSDFKENSVAPDSEHGPIIPGFFNHMASQVVVGGSHQPGIQAVANSNHRSRLSGFRIVPEDQRMAVTHSQSFSSIGGQV